MLHKNVLVTGSAGFIGSNFVNIMTKRHPHWNFFSIDKLDYCSNLKNLEPRSNHTFYKCNLNDANFVSFVLDHNNINVVVHFAAQSHVDNSFDNSLQYTEDNIKGTHTLLDCCLNYLKQKSIKEFKFLHMSTDEVYGETKKGEVCQCTEYSILNPTNPYAATKAAAEMLVNSYQYSYKFPSVVVRANNVYGPNQYVEKLIPRFIHLAKTGQPLTIHGTGETMRNFLHVFDLVEALDLVIREGKVGEVYNIGSEEEFSVMEIAVKISKMCGAFRGPTVKLEYVKDRLFNDYRYAINSAKLKKLGWKGQTITFDEGLEKLSTQ
jgi:UDP-glucose 4,6-dehydratase